MTKLEQVARAIDVAEVAWCLEHQKSAADMPCSIKALAALKAMHTPTEAMLDAGYAAFQFSSSGTRSSIGKSWRAMIDAAIAEEQT